MMEIRLVKQEELHHVKWDSCIHYANNGSLFGYRWFLNNVAKEWDALVEGDYESVFPLVWKQDIFKRKYLFQPMLTRALGIFSIHVLSPNRIQAFLDAIPSTYDYVQIALNEQNQWQTNQDYEWKKKKNYQLWLDQPYEVIQQNYAPEVVALIKEAKASYLRPVSNLKPERIAQFFKDHAVDRKDLEEKFHALQRIMYNAMHRGVGFDNGIENEKGELLAANYFIYGHGKLLSLLPIHLSHLPSKLATVYALDMLIKTNAGRPLILDLNSTDDTLKTLGALPSHYYQLQKDQRRWKLDKWLIKAG
ncbi:MAG: hypothetical protein HC912_00730 [Saprospiraceae bacterium]|nr:hypothetical protein [Saprospiraceae bacterium]